MQHNENCFEGDNRGSSFHDKVNEVRGQIGRQQRQAFIRGRRSLALSQHMVEQEIDWLKLSLHKLTQLITSTDNPFLWLRVLFRLMRDMEWRRWTSAMQLILQKLQNSLACDCSLMRTLGETQNLQGNLEYLCDLVCPNLQRHYLLLLASLLKFNRLFPVLNEPQLCQRMVRIAKHFPAMAQSVFWVIAPHAQTLTALEKALDCEYTESSALPLCSMLANFIVECPAEQATKLLGSQKLAQLAMRVLTQTELYELKRQLQVVYNNFLSKSLECFRKVEQSSQLMEHLICLDTEETWVTLFIFSEAIRNGYVVTLPEEIIRQRGQTLKAPCPLTFESRPAPTHPF